MARRIVASTGANDASAVVAVILSLTVALRGGDQVELARHVEQTALNIREQVENDNRIFRPSAEYIGKEAPQPVPTI